MWNEPASIRLRGLRRTAGSRGARWLALMVLAGCAQSAATSSRARAWDIPWTGSTVAQVVAIRLHDQTVLRLRSPRSDDNAVCGESMPSCVGAGCDAIRQSLCVPREQIAWMNLRHFSAEQARALPGVAPPGDPPPAPPVESARLREEANEVRSRGDATRAHHALYFGATSLFISNGIGINYCLRPVRMLAVSFGVGYSALSVPCFCFDLFSRCDCKQGGSGSAFGGQAMGHLLLGGATYNFEMAIGLALVTTDSSFMYGSAGRHAAVYPSAFVGMRMHPVRRGFIFRVGVAWEYGLAVGFHLGTGAAF